jgi:hypothetical protein
VLTFSPQNASHHHHHHHNPNHVHKHRHFSGYSSSDSSALDLAKNVSDLSLGTKVHDVPGAITEHKLSDSPATEDAPKDDGDVQKEADKGGSFKSKSEI